MDKHLAMSNPWLRLNLYFGVLRPQAPNCSRDSLHIYATYINAWIDRAKNEGVSSQRRLQEHLAHVRQGAKHDKRYQPVYQPKTHRTSSATSTKEEAKENSKLPFTVEQELEVCRRYLQDLICFDYGIPQNCIKHAAVVI